LATGEIPYDPNAYASLNGPLGPLDTVNVVAGQQGNGSFDEDGFSVDFHGQNAASTGGDVDLTLSLSSATNGDDTDLAAMNPGDSFPGSMWVLIHDGAGSCSNASGYDGCSGGYLTGTIGAPGGDPPNVRPPAP
jgi:hypothetical protein